jgi:adenylate kinase family enzyme
MVSRVLIVTGPGGSGKSTLAAHVAARLGWLHIGEDDRWVANGWGSGLRSAEHEAIVQQQVVTEARSALAAGRGVVIDHILYALPPNPLTAYQEALADAGVTTVVLRPPVDEILRRMVERGRPNDLAGLDQRRLDAEWQVAILGPDHIDQSWIVDPTDRPVDDLATDCIARLDAD